MPETIKDEISDLLFACKMVIQYPEYGIYRHRLADVMRKYDPEYDSKLDYDRSLGD